MKLELEKIRNKYILLSSTKDGNGGTIFPVFGPVSNCFEEKVEGGYKITLSVHGNYRIVINTTEDYETDDILDVSEYLWRIRLHFHEVYGSRLF